MPQENFIPTTGSTHLEARNIYNANADDAESRLSALESSSAGGQVDSIVAGSNVTVDNTDPVNPVVSSSASGGQVDSIVAGTNVTIDNTDPINPIINSAGGTALSGTTSNNTQTEIFVGGVASSRMTIATNTTWMFSAMVAARSATESAGYKIEGVIKNDGGTTSLVGVAVKTVFAEEDATWDITVEADDTNDALVFKVTGDSADSVVWEVTANKTEAS